MQPAPVELNQLVVLFNAGRHQELERCARSLLGHYPDSGYVWKILGASLQVQGKDSLAALQKATKLLPDDADTHYNLGNTYLSHGLLGDAEASYRRALQLRPDDADVHYNLGNTFRNRGCLDDAETSYRRALQIRPDFAEVHGNLGSLLLEQGRVDDAEASYRRALQVKPGYMMAHYNLGNILHELGRFDEAETSYRQALQLRPDFVEAYCNLGRTLQDIGQLVEAEACYRQALQVRPDYAKVHNNLGDFLLQSGRVDEAEACFQKALEIKPDLFETRFSIAQLRKVEPGDVNLMVLAETEKAVRQGTMHLPDKDAMYLHFALGKCHDDLGEYEKAFPYFLEGCRLKRATVEYDPDKKKRQFASIMHNFDAATIERLRGGGDSSRSPIFILGMPRSGTTLTEQIIASHPEVHGAGELPDLMEIAERSIAGIAFPDNVRLLDQTRLATWGAEYVAGLQRRAPDARHVTDKMPANFFAVGLIHLMLPNAKIIHVRRNPVDTCLSCFTALFKYTHEHTYDLAELGRYYADYARLMDHWRKVLPEGAFLDVCYEDIVADQETQARRIIDYCGLEWDDACLDFHKTERVVRTASLMQVRRPIYQSSVARWHAYEKFLGPLFDGLGELAPER